MLIDRNLVKMLNLINDQPQFVARETKNGAFDVLRPGVLPNNDGFYWVAGITRLRSGRELESVFVIDTDSGAEQANVFWRHGGVWYQHAEVDTLLGELHLSHGDFFPYEWKYYVKVANDIHA